MRCKIYPRIEKDNEQYFKLEQIGTAGIELTAVSKNGVPLTEGCILTITDKGISLSHNVSAEIGLPLDNYRRVIVNNS